MRVIPRSITALLILCTTGCGEICEPNRVDEGTYLIRENQSISDYPIVDYPIVDGFVTVEGDLATVEFELESGGRYRVVYRINDKEPDSG